MATPPAGRRATGFRFPGWRVPNTAVPTTAAVARGGDEPSSAVEALASTGDSDVEHEETPEP